MTGLLAKIEEFLQTNKPNARKVKSYYKVHISKSGRVNVNFKNKAVEDIIFGITKIMGMKTIKNKTTYTDVLNSKTKDIITEFISVKTNKKIYGRTIIEL